MSPRALSLTALSLVALSGTAQAYDLDEIPVTRWPAELEIQPITPEQHAELVPVEGPLVVEHLDALRPRASSRAEAERGRVLVLVEANLAERLSDSLDRFMEDLTLDGHSVLLESASGGSAVEIKEHLAELYAEDQGLEGALLIGDLPMAWFEFYNDYGTYGYAVFPCDLALMDLDGSWEDNDGNGVFDGHTDGFGDAAPELWVGRMIVTPWMGDETEVLEAYFDRNHAYRRGEILPNESSLVYVDDDWAYWVNDFDYEIGLAFPDTTAVSEVNTTRKDDYLPRLEQDFDNIAVFVHSSPSEHYFVYRGNYDTMLWDEVPGDTTALFYDLFACSNSNFAESIYMGGVYALNTEFGLLALGSTKTGSMLERTPYYRRLGEYEDFGHAFVGWWEDVQPYDVNQRDNWYYGMVQIGDPTLRVGYPTVALDTDSIVIDQAEAEPVTVTINLSNSGFDGYYWSLGVEGSSLEEQPWIQTDDPNGQVLGLDSSLTITFDPELAGGADPSQTLLIHAPGATNNPTPIALDIAQWGPPELCVSEELLHIQLEAVTDDGATLLEVGNCAVGELSWSAEIDQDWLLLDRSEGDGREGAEQVQISVDASGLAPGKSYTGLITFSSEQASNSPVSVEVQLDVPAGGVRRGKCGCAASPSPARLLWLPSLLLGAAVTLRRKGGRHP
jgi:hypothetical protein